MFVLEVMRYDKHTVSWCTMLVFFLFFSVSNWIFKSIWSYCWKI